MPPKNVTILNAEALPSGRIVIKGTEDVELALECLSVEVYPVASLNWYRDNDNTSTLIKNFESTIYDHSSNTYNISALARIVPSARDDNISYTCLSSFPDEPKLLTSTSAKLYLDCKFCHMVLKPYISNYLIIEPSSFDFYNLVFVMIQNINV